ncbi:caspase family protein [Dinoroseobacter sp. S76]|uniref:caspase family protein n=1 Tax=Dinoroseobacter sp. S76 TaxID=3415124 RepID=UPI003C7CD942
MKSILFRYIGGVVALLFMASVAAASTGERVALVVGNANYESASPLKNAINDADAISAKLSEMGFDVVQGNDLTYDALRDTVREFTRRARKADLTVFYYAGHGIAVDGDNYLVPIDATLSDPVDWEFEVYNVGEILRLIDRSPGPSLVFLDACRDNPMAATLASAQGMGSRSLNNRGISRIPTETMGTTGSVIAYATEPGQVAADGKGDNSPFAIALLNHLDTANTDFASITSLVTRDVIEMTEGVQRPRFDVSLTGPLILNAVAVPEPVVPSNDVAVLPTPNPTPVAPQDTLQVEKFMFEAAMTSNDVADFQAFLTAFPNSMFAPMAQNAITRLEGEAEEKKAEQMASLQTDRLPSQDLTRLVTLPLSLTVTPQAAALVSSEATERSLFMNKMQRRQVQLRLNVAGYNVGRPDGAIGPNTRRGLREWQAANAFPATGYLNNVQHQFLTASTKAGYDAHLASNPNALTPVVRQSGSSGKKNSSGSDFITGVIVGTGLGVILGK